jgi:hypothetical protein
MTAAGHPQRVETSARPTVTVVGGIDVAHREELRRALEGSGPPVES